MRWGFLLLATLLAVGCRAPAPTPEQGRLSAPPDGSVRLICTTIEEKRDRLHLKWSVLGDRNWVRARASATEMALEQTYPLNATDRRGGCHTWEFDLMATRDPAGALRWKTIVHGSNGATATASGTAPADGAPALPVRRLRTADALLRLPVNDPLVEIAGRPIYLRLPQ